jgi:hypothetical protein
MDHKTDFPPLLPDGLHGMTWGDIVTLCADGFPLPTTRAGLIAGLRRLVDDICACPLDGDMWLDGSFLTEKIDPDDVDLVFRIEEAALIAPTPPQEALLQRLGQSECRNDYGCDTYVFCDVPVGHPWHPGFDIRAYWLRLFGTNRSDEPKGIAVLSVPGGVS